MRDDFRTCLQGQRKDPVAIAARWKSLGFADCLRLLQRLLMDFIRCAQADNPPHLFNPDTREWLQAAAERINLSSVYALLHRVGQLLQDVEGPLDESLALEDLLIDLAELSGHT